MAVRILPKDEARVRFSYPARFGRVAASIAILALLAPAPWHAAAAADGSVSYALSDATAQRGVTLHSASDEIRLGLFPGALTGAATVQLNQLADLPAPLPVSGRYRAVTPAWEISIDQNVGDQHQPVSIAVPQVNLYRKLILMLTPGRTGWEKLTRGRLNGDGTRVQAYLSRLPTTVIVVDDTQVVEGASSWYRSTRYPNGAASNDFPLGTTINVTNLDNGKSVVATVVSTGPWYPGRVLDLTYGPFSQIADPAAGVAPHVRVERWGPAPIANAPPPLPRADTDTGGTPKGDGSAPPTVSAAQYVVVDQGSDVVLASRDADRARPIASISKVLTAAVFFDTKPDLNRVVSVRPEDAADCSCLRMGVGESARVVDFLGASLVGSANNATKVLRNSTGLSVEEFTARMRQKAASYGATSAYFVEPTGLDWHNVASASDVAAILEGAFREYPVIRDFVLKQSYSFSTTGGIGHTIRTTNPLLATSTLSITGGKTGYLVEAGYTMVLRARDSAGHQVIVVVLGEPSSAARFTDAETLLQWALSHHTWST